MLKINAAVIGAGSIGLKHIGILSKLSYVKKIYVVTKTNLKITNSKIVVVKNLRHIFNEKIDYFIISNPTTYHYRTLLKINNNFSNKIILVEKPLFDKYQIIGKLKNKVFVAYNLRFHPIIQYLKINFSNKKINYISVRSLSNLRTWRTNIKYNLSSSSEKKFGGGVVKDMSHEFDYITYIFGRINSINYFKKKLSNLKINTEDFFKIIFSNKNIKFGNLELAYFSKNIVRDINIHTNNLTVEANLVSNYINITHNGKIKKINFSKKSLPNSYVIMHKNILTNKHKNLCTIKDGLKLNKLMDSFK